MCVMVVFLMLLLLLLSRCSPLSVQPTGVLWSVKERQKRVQLASIKPTDINSQQSLSFNEAVVKIISLKKIQASIDIV